MMISAPIHPLLFAVLPILTLLAGNIEVIPIHQVYRPSAIAIGSGILVCLMLNFYTKDFEKAGAICSISLIFFFAYGHVKRTLQLFVSIDTAFLHLMLIPFFSALLLFIWWAIKREAKRTQMISKYLNITALIWILIPVTRIVSHEAQLRKEIPAPFEMASFEEMNVARGDVSSYPDIYYIVLDGYARSDILNQIYGMTNQSFVQFLTDQGFYIANRSRSNYAQTSLSITSTLNMDYVDNILVEIDIESHNVVPLTRHIRNSIVRKTLEILDYELIAFSSGYRRTEIEDADLYLSPPSKHVTTLEAMILQTSGAVIILDMGPLLGFEFSFPGYQTHRDRVLYTFEKLPELAKEQADHPRFIFAHILVPHPPFVFNSDGNAVAHHTHYGLEDGSYFPGTREDYIRGYKDQLIYTNTMLTSTIKAILDCSAMPPVILLQADHGPASSLDWWAPPDEDDLRERMSILNAYYLPGIEKLPLYDTISPVNSFRVVFNHYFGTKYPLLPDKTYYSSVRQPYDLILLPEEDDLNEVLEE